MVGKEERRGRVRDVDEGSTSAGHKAKGCTIIVNPFEGALEFKKAEVQRVGGTVGGLALLKLDEEEGTEEEKEKKIPLRIYLPDCNPLDFGIPENATVDDAIVKTLRFWEEQGGDKGGGLVLHTHAPQCYELRLHEGDGEPDEVRRCVTEICQV